ncbi:hypothetical protein FXO38_13734 [Capsicum annuum]|nr:hypothetical protein FXO38_13734 [Capsicum annuum]KAF3680881.1 hypothetical protein FXO37_03114 [Capsicum annuum]
MGHILQPRPHDHIIHYISRMGLYDIIRIGKIQFDHPLVTAMAKRWRPETHTFHLPFGEVSITLQDVEVLFGLRTDAFAYANVMDHHLDWRTMLRDFTGIEVEPAAINGHCRISISMVVNYLWQELLLHPITVETPEDRVQSIARLYMLLLMGGILFTNTSTSLLKNELEEFNTIQSLYGHPMMISLTLYLRVVTLANQVLVGPIFPDVEYLEPPVGPGRGGRGHAHGSERGHERGGAVPVQRGGRGWGRLPVQPEPQIHPIVDPESHPTAEVKHIPDIGTTQIQPFDPSPYTPACSSMPQPYHFSTYIAPSWVDEEVHQSYDDMHYHDILHLSHCSISDYPSESAKPFTSQPVTDDPVDMQVLEEAHSIIPDAYHAPTNVTKETQDPVYKKKSKKKRCADPVAAITKKYHNDGDDDARGGLRPYTSIQFRACGT